MQGKTVTTIVNGTMGVPRLVTVVIRCLGDQIEHGRKGLHRNANHDSSPLLDFEDMVSFCDQFIFQLWFKDFLRDVLSTTWELYERMLFLAMLGVPVSGRYPVDKENKLTVQMASRYIGCYCIPVYGDEAYIVGFPPVLLEFLKTKQCLKRLNSVIDLSGSFNPHQSSSEYAFEEAVMRSFFARSNFATDTSIRHTWGECLRRFEGTFLGACSMKSLTWGACPGVNS